MIDFIIAWVNGNDPKWINEKNNYQTDETQDVSEARYRDWDNLQYWFRAVEKYATWVRKIHFVTYGHIPKWLNIDNPKIHIVKHEDFIPKEYLPTFNSHTIELNLHRIEGLSEQFVYFNDDMFLTAPTEENYFFKDGKPCDEFILDAVYFSPDSAGAYNGNDLELINKHFNLKKIRSKYSFIQLYNPSYGIKNLFRNITLIQWPWFTGFHYNHLPTSILKSTMCEIWEEEYETLNRTCLDKFRSKRNVNQWLFKYWQLASGNFYPRSPKSGRVFHLKKAPCNELSESILKQRYKMICINDKLKTQSFDEHKEAVIKALETMLPYKSKYEL